ncbi:hypothetical protein V6N13_022094 [Hibiscus sabdariffa]
MQDHASRGGVVDFSWHRARLLVPAVPAQTEPRHVQVALLPNHQLKLAKAASRRFWNCTRTKQSEMPPMRTLKKFDVHDSSVGDDAPKKTTTKFDHLVLGPAAGEGLSNRLQCQGVKALNKTHFSNSPHASGVGDGVVFVTVFTIYNNTPDTPMNSRLSNLVTVGNASYSKPERSMAILNVFINFIKVRMPHSNVIILTDPESDLSMHQNQVTVLPIRGEYSRDKLMLQRIRSYITFLEIKLEKLSQEKGRITHFFFTDSDIAVIDDLGQIFDKYQDFHLALTFRNNKDQPLNSGFIALALFWVVKSDASFDAKRFSKAQAFTKEIGGASVLFLPCATYNWTPPEGAGQFHGMPLDVKVVHFKGSRKRLMLEAWNYFSSFTDTSDMLCLILRSGRTKYDF